MATFQNDDLFLVCRNGVSKKVTYLELDGEWVKKSGDTMTGDLIIEGEVADGPVTVVANGTYYEITNNSGPGSQWIQVGATSNAVGEVFQCIRDFTLTGGNEALALTNPAHLIVGGYVQTSEVKTPHFNLEELPNAA